MKTGISPLAAAIRLFVWSVSGECCHARAWSGASSIVNGALYRTGIGHDVDKLRHCLCGDGEMTNRSPAVRSVAPTINAAVASSSTEPGSGTGEMVEAPSAPSLVE
jgi:hypothetical protein